MGVVEDMPDSVSSDHICVFLPSPYAKVVSLRFADQVLQVHESLLVKLQNLPRNSLSDTLIDLSHINAAAGHVIVHYLYNGIYELPGLTNDQIAPEEQAVAALRTSLEVYAVARDFELGDLSELSKSEVEMTAEKLEPMKALQVIKEALPRPSTNDSWLRDYSKALLSSTCSSLASFIESDLMAALTAEPTISITEMFLLAVIDLDKEKAQEEAAALKKKESDMAAEALRIKQIEMERDALLAKLQRKGKLLKKERARFKELDQYLGPCESDNHVPGPGSEVSIQAPTATSQAPSDISPMVIKTLQGREMAMERDVLFDDLL